MKFKFVWEEWVDPLSPQDFNNNQDIDDDDDDDDDEGYGNVGQHSHSFKAFPTPFGMLSISNHVLASSKFDFWLLHTNFPITNEIAYMMKKVPGVETMNVLTRYRVRFGFPKSGLFNSNEVKEKIEKAALGVVRQKQDKALSVFDQKTSNQAREVRDYLDEHNEHWALYVLPNGHMEIIKQKVMRDGKFNDKLDTLKFVRQLVGGTLLTSDED